MEENGRGKEKVMGNRDAETGGKSPNTPMERGVEGMTRGEGSEAGAWEGTLSLGASAGC